MPVTQQRKPRVAVLHGGGYTGRELIRLLLNHPYARLAAVTSRTFAGKPLHKAHPEITGTTDLRFSHPEDLNTSGPDAVLVAAEHGQSVRVVTHLLEQGFCGAIVDLSADFRLNDPADYERWYGFKHPASELLSRFEYGLTEITAPYEGQWIANPGCFATGMTLALYPLQKSLVSYHASITALTGASGSGARHKPTTHYPTRDGNLRAYKVLHHQHLPEVLQILCPGAQVSMIPVSGPWTRGIWGTIQVQIPAESNPDWKQLYEEHYGTEPLVRLWPDRLPELRYAAGTPFCDIGWIAKGDTLVIGFALDNLLKGAASQAIQNLNAACGLPTTAGLLPT